MKPAIVLLFLMSFLSVIGCTDSNSTSNPVVSGNSNPANNNTSANDSASLTLECEATGQPCSMAEVDPEILSRSVTLADRALASIEDGSNIATQAKILQNENGMASVVHDEKSLRFVLEDGRPFWVVPDLFVSNDDSQNELSPDYLQRVGSLRKKTVETPINAMVRQVVHTDEEEKRALVLAPYLWDFGVQRDDAVPAAEILKTMRGYENTVDFYADVTQDENTIPFDLYRNWQDYDVIHFSTHGTQICTDERCYSQLLAGTRFNLPTNNNSSSASSLAGAVGAAVVTTSKGTIYTLEEPFFQRYYGNGLEDVHIALMGCESAKGPDLLERLGTDSSVVLGWTEIVLTSRASDVTAAYYQEIRDSGRVSKKAFEEIQDAGLHQYTDADGKLVTLVRSEPRNDLRLREIVTAYNPYTTGYESIDELDEGDALPIIGTPDDGASDSMPFRVVVEGIEPDESGNYELQILLDGNASSQRWSLADATQVDAFSYVITGEADFGIDFKSYTEKYELVFRVELPDAEQGTSFYRVELSPPASWTLSLAGPRESGVYSGDRSTIYPSGGLLVLGTDNPLGSKSVSFKADFDPAFTNGVNSYALGLTSSGGSRSNITVFDTAVSGPESLLLEIRNGDGSTVSIAGGLSSFTFPPSPVMTVANFNNDSLTVSGSVVGTYFYYDGTDLEPYSVSIKFDAINCDHPSRPSGCFLGQ